MSREMPESTPCPSAAAGVAPVAPARHSSPGAPALHWTAGATVYCTGTPLHTYCTPTAQGLHCTPTQQGHHCTPSAHLLQGSSLCRPKYVVRLSVQAEDRRVTAMLRATLVTKWLTNQNSWYWTWQPEVQYQLFRLVTTSATHQWGSHGAQGEGGA